MRGWNPVIRGRVEIWGGRSIYLNWSANWFAGAGKACWIGRSMAKYHASAMIVPNIASAIINITSFFRASDCCISDILSPY